MISLTIRDDSPPRWPRRPKLLPRYERGGFTLPILRRPATALPLFTLRLWAFFKSDFPCGGCCRSSVRSWYAHSITTSHGGRGHLHLRWVTAVAGLPIFDGTMTDKAGADSRVMVDTPCRPDPNPHTQLASFIRLNTLLTQKVILPVLGARVDQNGRLR